MSPVLDIQRRGQQIGRLRIGQQVPTGNKDKNGNDKMRPERLDTFRFTTASRTAAAAIAELYGGTVRDWEGAFEVVTGKSEIGVTVPPRDQVVSQYYEMWTAGGCQRRCDSQRQQNGQPCQCPHAASPADEASVARAAAERARLASLNPPQACKLVTRISVMIPDLPGLGVFRLDTGSYYAATEIGDSAALMQMARDQGIFLPAILRIEHRSRVANGQTKKYPVPVLEVLATFRQIATGALEAGGITAQLPPAPGEQPKAITAARPAPAASPGPDPVPPPPDPGDDDAGPDEDWQTATRIYQRALAARNSRELTACKNEAEHKGVLDAYVCTDRASDTWTPLQDALRDVWRAKAQDGAT